MGNAWFFIVIHSFSRSLSISFTEFCSTDDILEMFGQYDKTSEISEATSGRIKQVEIYELLSDGKKKSYEKLSSELKEKLEKVCGPVYGSDY